MKIEMTPVLHPQRGGEVKVGNVYSNPHGRFYKIVVGMKDHGGGRVTVSCRSAYNNVICVHVDSMGEIVGASVAPEPYIQQHQDLVGIVKEMPTLKIEWLRASTAKKNK